MGSVWFWNFMQYIPSKVDHSELRKIPFPYLEIGIHPWFKVVEFAGFVGGCIANPLYKRYYLKNVDPAKVTRNTPRIALKAARKLGTRITMAGMVIGAPVGIIYCLARGIERVEIYDRCFRLRYNKKQLYVDRSTALCGVVGFYGNRGWGMVIGMNVGLVFSVLYCLLLWEHGLHILRDKVMELPQDYEQRKLKMEHRARFDSHWAEDIGVK